MIEYLFQTFLAAINFVDQFSFRVVGSDIVVLASVVVLVAAVYIGAATLIKR
jgi:hypothetical protein